MFGKGENLVATDYQMVRHPDIHQAQCLYQTFGDKPVCLTGCDFTGRVIVCQYHGSGIVVQGAFNHFPGMDFRAVDGAGEEGFTGNQLILVVQIQHPEFFTLQSRHVQNQPFPCCTGGGEGHAGFMKMAVQGFQGPLNEAALAGRHLSGQKGKLLHCASLHSVDDAHNGAAFRMLQGVIPQPVIMDRHGIILRTTGMMTVRHQTGGNTGGFRAHFCAVMLIVNLDTHRPLVLLPGRDQRTLATWFRKYPEIQVVSRDRSGVYATAAREGAPQARQVADRWHLLKNIGDEPERMMYRHMPLIRLVVRELSLKKSPEPEISVPVASLRRLERLKQHIRKKRHQRWTEVMALHNKGCSFREISRITGLSRVTVSRWVGSGTFPEMSTRPPKRGLLDPWREWLKEQRECGNYNSGRIWREMVARGVTGSETIVRDAVAKWRKGWIPPVTTAARLPSVSRVSRWLMPWRIIRGEENYAFRFISLMCEKEPELKIAQQLVLEFYRILKT